jgi:hypothetical protein
MRRAFEGGDRSVGRIIFLSYLDPFFYVKKNEKNGLGESGSAAKIPNFDPKGISVYFI